MLHWFVQYLKITITIWKKNAQTQLWLQEIVKAKKNWILPTYAHLRKKKTGLILQIIWLKNIDLAEEYANDQETRKRQNSCMTFKGHIQCDGITSKSNVLKFGGYIFG